MTTASDLSKAYFTAARLKRLRELHLSFPLWAGDWPAAGADAPESLLTDRQIRWGRTIDELIEDRHVWRDAGWSWLPKTATDCLVLMSSKDEITVSSVAYPTPHVSATSRQELEPGVPLQALEVPTVIRALLGAITYAAAPWVLRWHGKRKRWGLSKRPDSITFRDVWPGRLTEILELTHPFALRKPFRKHVVFGFGLWQMYREAAMASIFPDPGDKVSRKTPRRDPDRAKLARRRLTRYWERIGEEVGIIPSRRGDASHGIPPDLLASLRDQAKGLCDAVRTYSPSQKERDTVICLLTNGPYIANINQWQAAQQMASEDGRHKWAADVRLDLWCARLAFPMLAKEEILRANPALGGKSEPPPRGHWWLVGMRFGLDPRLLQRQLTPSKVKGK